MPQRLAIFTVFGGILALAVVAVMPPQVEAAGRSAQQVGVRH
jgi:hypothetical protein